MGEVAPPLGRHGARDADDEVVPPHLVLSHEDWGDSVESVRRRAQHDVGALGFGVRFIVEDGVDGPVEGGDLAGQALSVDGGERRGEVSLANLVGPRVGRLAGVVQSGGFYPLRVLGLVVCVSCIPVRAPSCDD